MKNADESIYELKKKVDSFRPDRAAFWGDGERVPCMFIARAFDAISKESSRIVTTGILCDMLRTVIEMKQADDLAATVYLLANRIAPAHEGLELAIGDAIIIKALAEACGINAIQLKKQYKKLETWALLQKNVDHPNP